MSSVSNSLNTFTLFENQQFSSTVNKLSKYKDAGSIGAAKNQNSKDEITKADNSEKTQSEFLKDLIGSQEDTEVQGILASDDSEKVSYLYSDTEEETTSEIKYDGKSSTSIVNSFDLLAAEVGANGEGISKYQLIAYLQNLVAENETPMENSKEISFVRKLIATFDDLSDGSNYITSFNNVNEPQDPETVTQDQLKFPIDISV